jgi:mono/diheme cytochrome c family protein
MPPFASLTDEQVNELVDYLLSLATSVQPTSSSSNEVQSVGRPTTLPTQAAISSPLAVPSVSATLGPPGPAADAIGRADHGAVLFTKYCASCHGPGGVGGIPNLGSSTGKVPPLHRIARALFSSEPQIFAENIDRIIQHGSVAEGPSPQFRMPAFGDTNTLTQQEIADLEAYILRLNGIDRAQIANPGLLPRRFFFLVVTMFGVGGIGLAGGWLWTRKRLSIRNQ